MTYSETIANLYFPTSLNLVFKLYGWLGSLFFNCPAYAWTSIFLCNSSKNGWYWDAIARLKSQIAASVRFVGGGCKYASKDLPQGQISVIGSSESW